MVLSQVLLEANVSERLFKHRVKALVTVSASWRNITRKLLHDNNICFHIFYPMLYCGILRKLLNGLKNVKLLPVKIHLSGGDLHSNTVRKFLFRFSGEILELIFTSNLALQGSVDVFSKCMFPNLKTLRICVTNKDTEIACVAEDVSPLIIAVLATAHKLVNFGYHNIGDGKLCDKGFSSQIKLPKSLRKLEIFTHRLDTITSNLTFTGLTHLNEIKVAYVSGYPTCACPREIPQSFLIHLLLCSGSSLDQALICSIDRVLPVCLTLPALQRIRSLTLRNIVLPGTTDAFNLNSEFPALKHLFITACSPTILIHLISPDSNSLKSFQFIASANKLIPHKGEICELILNRVIGGLQNCKCMIISWRSMQAMQKAMPIIFRNATNLERLQLELEVRFWTTTSTNLAMEEILTGLSRENLALAKRQCCPLYESAFKTGGIQNLTGLCSFIKTISVDIANFQCVFLAHK